LQPVVFGDINQKLKGLADHNFNTLYGLCQHRKLSHILKLLIPFREKIWGSKWFSQPSWTLQVSITLLLSFDVSG